LAKKDISLLKTMALSLLGIGLTLPRPSRANGQREAKGQAY
jgi:hypothetical protein